MSKGCDSFEPIAKCAQNIVHKNGFSDRINIIFKRSNELTVDSQNSDLSRRADLLVAELFDTELIGEGAISTYRHAVQNLLTPNAILVPSRARIYCQLIESKSLYNYHQFREHFKIEDNLIIKSPESVNSCNGSNVLHDIQINELKPNEDFVLVSEPEVVFDFEFNNLSTLTERDSKVIEFKVTRDISGPLVLFMWWALDMDSEGEIVLSCAPFWTFKEDSVTPKTVEWRDHWMQSIYYFPANDKHFELKSGEVVRVVANRDEYSLWFHNFDNKNNINSQSVLCECGLHLFLSRTRIQMINDISRLKVYNKAIEGIVNNSNRESIDAIYLGDSSLLPIMTAKNNKIGKVLCLLKNKQTENFIKSFAKSNDLEEKIQIIQDFDQINDKSVDLVLSEPYFNSSDVPWNHLHFWYLLNNIPPNILSENVMLIPNKAVIKAIPIEFDNLWKIRAEVGSNVEGFDLSFYDQLIQKAVSLSDDSIESQPLWEYPGKAMADKPFELFSFDLRKAIETQSVLKSFVKFDIRSHLPKLQTKYISIAFWVEFHLFDNLIENSGPIGPIINGNYIEWNRHYRQGVCFLPNIDVLNKEKTLDFYHKF